MAGTHPIVTKQGRTFKLSFNIATNGVPWNLTGYTASMQVKRSTSSTDVLLNITNDDVTMDSIGNVSVVVSSTRMNLVPSGRWIYDFKLNSGSEDIDLLEGRFIVKPEVTA